MKNKFYYLTEEKLHEIMKLYYSKDETNSVLLSSKNGFSDVARYNSRYDTIVILTIKD